VPYEHNAGTVYDEYIRRHVDIVVPFEKVVFEPCADHHNSPYSKQDMRDRKVPCIVVAHSDCWRFEQAVSDKRSTLYYFGDKMPPYGIIVGDISQEEKDRNYN